VLKKTCRTIGTKFLDAVAGIKRVGIRPCGRAWAKALAAGEAATQKALSAPEALWPRVLPNVPIGDHLPPGIEVQKAIGAGILHDYDAVTRAVGVEGFVRQSGAVLGGGGSAQHVAARIRYINIKVMAAPTQGPTEERDSGCCRPRTV